MLNIIAASLMHTKSLLNCAEMDTSVGVRQGGSSSCFLFTMFVNPLIQALKRSVPDGFLQNVHVLLLMDDTAIFATSREKLIAKMQILECYCSEYGMVINEGKTQFLTVNCEVEAPIQLGSLTITPTKSYTYLGSPVMDCSIHLQVKEHMARKQTHCRKFVSFLARNYDAPFYVKRNVWQAALNSALLYSCESWFCHNIKSVEVAYMQTIKDLLGVRIQTPNDLCLVELGVPPVKATIVSRQLKMLQRIRSLPHFEGSPAHHMLQISVAGRTSMGKYLVWLDNLQHPNYVAHSFRSVCERVMESDRSKCQTYRQLNCELSTHPVYAQKHVIAERYRVAFSRIRLSSHYLKIETGRWARIERQNRVCPCDHASIQTEEHALCFCALTENLRHQFPQLHYHNVNVLLSDHQNELYEFVFKVLTTLYPG